MMTKKMCAIHFIWICAANFFPTLKGDLNAYDVDKNNKRRFMNFRQPLDLLIPTLN